MIRNGLAPVDVVSNNALVESILAAGKAQDPAALHALLDEASRPEEKRTPVDS